MTEWLAPFVTRPGQPQVVKGMAVAILDRDERVTVALGESGVPQRPVIDAHKQGQADAAWGHGHF